MAEVIRSVTLKNKYGLHMRPAHRFMDMANSFACDVRVRQGERMVSGKSILDLTTLGAQCGSTLDIICSGEDAVECAEQLARFLQELAETYGEALAGQGAPSEDP